MLRCVSCHLQGRVHCHIESQLAADCGVDVAVVATPALEVLLEDARGIVVIIVNVMAYLIGNSLPKLLAPLMGETMWVYVTSTFTTTMVLGFSFEFVMNFINKGRREEQPDFKQRWIVRLNDRIVPVKTEQIAYFFSENKSNFLVADDGNKYLIDSTIESIEKELDPTKFFRINRGGIVALSAIDSAKKIAGRYVVEVHPALGLTMIVARSRVDTFLDWLAR